MSSSTYRIAPEPVVVVGNGDILMEVSETAPSETAAAGDVLVRTDFTSSVVLQDLFDGVANSPPDATKWAVTKSAAALDPFHTTDARMRMTSDGASTDFSALEAKVNGAALEMADVHVRLQTNSTSGGSVFISVRGSGAIDYRGYADCVGAWLGGNNFYLIKRVAGVWTVLTSVLLAGGIDFIPTNVRLLVVGNRIRAKQWPVSGTEPTTWTYDAVVTGMAASGKVAVVSTDGFIVLNDVTIHDGNPDHEASVQVHNGTAFVEVR